jgi:UDP-2-acetamido-3-amino-2,3-dideoxy-glucuronate N-acetyltransferase
MGSKIMKQNDLVHPGESHRLSVTGCLLITLRQHEDERGPLAILGQGDAALPFTPVRLFLTHNTTGACRGEHAHRECHQLLLCLQGSVCVLIESADQQQKVWLSSPSQALYIPPMIWSEQTEYSADARVLVLASHPYDAEDYLRSREAWRMEQNERPKLTSS